VLKRRSRKPVSPGLRWSAEWLAGSRKTQRCHPYPWAALCVILRQEPGAAMLHVRIRGGVVGDHDSYSDRLRRMAVTEGNAISFLLAKTK